MRRCGHSVRGVLRGSTVSVGSRRITGTIASSQAGKTIVVEVRNRKGRVVRTLTLSTRESVGFTLFVPAGNYRVTISSTAKGSSLWNLPGVRVPR